MSPSDREDALKQFEQGNKYTRGSLISLAEQAYKAAIDLWPHPAFYYNLAKAQLRLARTVDSYYSFEEATRYGPEPLGQERHDEALELQQYLLTQLATVIIECNEPGAIVTLNGDLIAVSPRPYRRVMASSIYSINAEKVDRIPDERQEFLPPGKTTRVSLVLRYHDTERRWTPWAPRAVLAAGLGVVALSSVAHWRARAGFEKYDKAFAIRCPEGCGQVEELADQRSRAEVWRLGATAGYALGATVLVGAAVLYYLNREKHVIREGGPGDSGSDLAIVPTVGDTHAGVTALLNF